MVLFMVVMEPLSATMKPPKHKAGTPPNAPYAIRTGPKPEKVFISFMSLRSDTPLWQLRALDTESTIYKAIKALNLPVSEVTNGDGGVLPDVFLVYIRTDEEAYRVYSILQSWPRTHAFKEKILRYMAENSPYKLP